MKKVIDAYVEAITSMKKFMDEVENAKVKLKYNQKSEYTEIDTMVRSSLEKSPFYHPSIDDIVNEVMDYIKSENDAPTTHLDPFFRHIAPNYVYNIILDYFPNNPILMDHVSGVIKNGIIYHTFHWKDTVDKIMDYEGISRPTKVRLTEHVLESGEIKIGTDDMLRCYFGEYDTVVKLINEINKKDDENEESI